MSDTGHVVNTHCRNKYILGTVMTESDDDIALRTSNLARDAAAALAALARFDSIVNEHVRLHQPFETKFGRECGAGVDFMRHMRAGRDFRKSTLLRVLNHIATADMLT